MINIIKSKRASKRIWISLGIIVILIAVAFFTTKSELEGLGRVTGMAEGSTENTDEEYEIRHTRDIQPTAPTTTPTSANQPEPRTSTRVTQTPSEKPKQTVPGSNIRYTEETRLEFKNGKYVKEYKDGETVVAIVTMEIDSSGIVTVTYAYTGHSEIERTFIVRDGKVYENDIEIKGDNDDNRKLIKNIKRDAKTIKVYNIDIINGLRGLATLDWFGQLGFAQGMINWFENTVFGKLISGDVGEAMCFQTVEKARKEGSLIIETPAGLTTTGAHVEGTRASIRRPVRCDEPECRLRDCNEPEKPDCDVCSRPDPTEPGTCLDHNNEVKEKTEYIYKVTLFITNPERRVLGDGFSIENKDDIKFNIKISDGRTDWLFVDSRTKQRRDRTLAVGDSYSRAGTNPIFATRDRLFNRACIVISEGATNLGTTSDSYELCKTLVDVRGISSEGYERAPEGEGEAEGEEAGVIENPDWS